MKIGKNRIRTVAAAIGIAAITFLVAFSQLLYTPDKLLTDPLFQTPSVPDSDIKILAIDEKTIAEYGEYSDWSREIPARLTETLNADPQTAPAVLAFDIIYASERDETADARFAAACADAGNVVVAVNLVYRDGVSASGGTVAVKRNSVSMVEYPYAALRPAVDYGFANTYLDRDQFVRYAGLSADYNGETIRSFAAAIYCKYAEKTGAEVRLPRTGSRGVFNFAYTGKSGAYEVIPLCDVLEGRVPVSAFSGSVVLVGAYASGLQDHYNAAVQHGTQMYGVEIQANILQAMMDGKTGTTLAPVWSALIAACVAAAYYLLIRRLKIVVSAVCGAGIIALDLAAAKLLYLGGVTVSVLETVLAVVLVYVFHLAFGFLAETIKKRKIIGAFKKYVAPQVVEEVAERGDFTVKLGGEKRNIAVLFVDIRGFTPMSEGLEPEQVVEILNEYLALTTAAIFKNGGTLDKFIGDATMAVFNAPFNLDDYVYRAVCTARDIAAGSEELRRKLQERFGKTVSFGIGVNCGEAVVGNIGCDVRMDYTAIGDTVNTAARLESNAGRGQILISRNVYEAVRDRVRVTEIGAIPLKGKSKEVFVYQLDEVI